MSEPLKQNQTSPFKKTGLVLLIIGIIDICFFAYCIVNKINYASSFNIFAVIAGVLLIRGGIKTARVIRWFSIFMAVTLIGSLVLTPFTTPIALLVTQVKLNMFSMLFSVLLSIVAILILIWIYLQLSSPQSLQLFSNHGYKVRMPKSACIMAISLIILVFGFKFVLLNGTSSEKAKSLAEEQLGKNYNYHIVSISIVGNSGQAQVLAYSSDEIKDIIVRW